MITENIKIITRTEEAPTDYMLQLARECIGTTAVTDSEKVLTEVLQLAGDI